MPVSYGPYPSMEAAVEHLAAVFREQYPTVEEMSAVLATVALHCAAHVVRTVNGDIIIKGFINEAGDLIK
jgi:hypothetical protein